VPKPLTQRAPGFGNFGFQIALHLITTLAIFAGIYFSVKLNQLFPLYLSILTLLLAEGLYLLDKFIGIDRVYNHILTWRK
jgi:hypothetical protein